MWAARLRHLVVSVVVIKASEEPAVFICSENKGSRFLGNFDNCKKTRGSILTNKSQRDTQFLYFILVKNSTCFGQTYCPSSGVLILYSQQLVFVILVVLSVQTVNVTSTINTNCCECSIKTPDDGQ